MPPHTAPVCSSRMSRSKPAGGEAIANALVGELHRREAEEAGFAPEEWRGIFLMQGQRLSLSSFTISMNEQGEITSDGPKLSTGVEMAPYWLSIAIDHAVAAERLAAETNEAWKGDDAEAQSRALDAEFKITMQAMTAAAFAIDAFYATVQEEVPAPEATRAAWKRNGTSRSRRAFETFRRSFPLKQSSQQGLKLFLDQLFSFRDTAVHPSARTRDAVKHPRLPVSVDQLFCIFRAQNACVSVGQVVDLLERFSTHPDIRFPKLKERIKPLSKLIEPLARQWRDTPAAIRHRREQELASEHEEKVAT